VDLWSKPEKLVALWARQNPDSSRAQATQAIFEIQDGKPDAAYVRLLPLWKKRPGDLQIAFNFVDAACSWQGLSPEHSQMLATGLREGDTGLPLVNKWLGKAIEVAGTGQCPGLELPDVERWASAALQNPRINSREVRDQDMEPLLAQIELRKRNPDEALHHFDRALAAFITPDVAARQASMLASNGYYEQALAHLDNYERLKSMIRPHGISMALLHAKVLEWQGYWPHEMAALRSKLHAAIATEIKQSRKNVPRVMPPS
jgi:predicted Zn-dependent protease